MGLKRHVTILVIAVTGLTAMVYAQAPAVSLSTIFAPKAGAAVSAEPETRSIRLLVGRSAIVDVGVPIARVSLTSPEVADALVTKPDELLINGKTPGTISMFVWDRSGSIQRFEVNVQRDLVRLTAEMNRLFPNESIDVRGNGKDVVLSGIVSNKDVADKVVSLAGGFVDKKEEVVNVLQLREGARSNQVLLRVRFAEVSRSALTELGSSFFTSPTGVKNTLARTTTEQFAAPGYTDLKYSKQGFGFGSPVTGAEGKFTFSDFLNLFIFSEKYDLGAMVRALQTKGLFQSLAEPNLVAESGKEASFLAGGEFPIPVAQASSGGTTISIVFKEFGIRLNFTPVVTGNRVHLKVRPEVSTLDFNNAIVLQGFRIPALSTRRTETEIELDNRQTFAIAGLLNNTMNSSLQKIPGIGDIPILGLLFKSKAAEKSLTELVVMITPEILPLNSNGVTPNLPRLVEPYLAPLPQKKVVDPPAPAFQPAAPGGAQNAAPPSNSPATPTPAAAAAAAVSALTPTKLIVVHAPDPTPATTDLLPTTPLPVQPTSTTSPATSTTDKGAVSGATRPATAEERKVVERARKEEGKRAEADARAKAAEAKHQAQQVEAERRKQKADEELQAKLAREQAKRDAEAARRAAEQAQKQAEVDKRQQKVIAQAEARAKAAQAAHDLDVAKTQKR